MSKKSKLERFRCRLRQSSIQERPCVGGERGRIVGKDSHEDEECVAAGEESKEGRSDAHLELGGRLRVAGAVEGEEAVVQLAPPPLPNVNSCVREGGERGERGESGTFQAADLSCFVQKR